MIDAVVFDLDGTLFHVPIDYERLFEEFKKILQVENVRPLIYTISKTSEKNKKLVFVAWEKAERLAFEKISINKSGIAIYRMYKDKPKALVTLQGQVLVNAILRKYDLSFAAVITREDDLFRENQLTKAAERLNVEIQNLLFVGNTEGDAAASKKLNCQFQKVG